MPETSSFSQIPNRPLKIAKNITANDSTTYDPPIILLRIETAGTLICRNLDGNSVDLGGVADGALIPGPFDRVLDAGTTATGFTAWFNE